MTAREDWDAAVTRMAAEIKASTAAFTLVTLAERVFAEYERQLRMVNTGLPGTPAGNELIRRTEVIARLEADVRRLQQELGRLREPAS